MRHDEDDTIKNYKNLSKWSDMDNDIIPDMYACFCSCPQECGGGDWTSIGDCDNCLGYGFMPIPWSEVKE